jgi:predicted nucleic acid-binding protein
LIFCDTSALAKYYVDETGSVALRSQLDSEDAVIASDCLHLITALHHGFEELCTFDRHARAGVKKYRNALRALAKL